MKHRKRIMSDAEAKRIITELYEQGYQLAAHTIQGVFGISLTREERDDLIHDGFLRLIPHVEKLADKSMNQRLGYMVAVMRSVAVEEGRRRSKSVILQSVGNDDFWEKIAFPEPSPEDQYLMTLEKEERESYRQAVLEQLNEREQELLIAKFQEGLSDADIGSRLKIKPRNVRVYISRARHKAVKIYGEIVNEGKQRALQEKRKQRQQQQQQQAAGETEPKEI